MSTSIDAAANEWTKVVSSEKAAKLRITLTNPSKYFFDIVAAGDPVPSPEVITGSRLPEHGMDFQGRDPIDVYIYAFDRAGRVDVDLEGPFTDVFLQDPTTAILDWQLSENLNAVTLLNNSVVNSETVTLEPGHGVLVGDWLEFFEGRMFLQTEATGVAGDVITIDMPMDQPFTTLAVVNRVNVSMDVDGSTGDITFDFCPSGDNKYDVTRALLVMTHTSGGDDSLFGNLTSLTNGVYFRKHNGINKNLFNAKNNGQFRLRAFDLDYSDKAGPGQFSTSVRRSFAGQDKNGVVIRIDSTLSDALDAVVRDNLTGLLEFRIVLQGHVVD